MTNPMERLTHLSRRLTEAPAFELGIVAVIIINGLLLGVATSPTMERDFGDWIGLGYQVALAIFIVEALLKDDGVIAARRRVLPGWLERVRLPGDSVRADSGDRAVCDDRPARAPAARAETRVDDQGPEAHRGGARPIDSQCRARHHADEHHGLHLCHHRLPPLQRRRP